MFDICIFFTNLFKFFIRLLIGFFMLIVLAFYCLFKIIADSFSFLKDKSGALFDYTYDKVMNLPLKYKKYDNKDIKDRK